MKIKGFKDTIDWYNQNAEKYIYTADQNPSLDQIDQFVRLLKPEAKVLDAGCAGGRDTKLLFDAGLNAVGLDLSHGLIENARMRFPDLEFVEGSFLEIPFSSESFDGVWSHASLLHLENTNDVFNALTEFNRVLKQNGILHVLVKKQTGAEKTAIISDKFSNHDRFFQYFTKEEIEGLIVQNGFKIIESSEYNEAEKDPKGRPEVEWILVLARKI